MRQWEARFVGEFDLLLREPDFGKRSEPSQSCKDVLDLEHVKRAAPSNVASRARETRVTLTPDRIARARHDIFDLGTA
jgi:hypothetical protein